MADLGKKRTGLSEREALLDMKGTERYLLERYRSALERGGSTRVRACLVAGFDKTAGDLRDVDEQSDRRDNSFAAYAREDDEQKTASKYKRYAKELENGMNMTE